MLTKKELFSNILENADNMYCTKSSPWRKDMCAWISERAKKAIFVAGIELLSTASLAQSNVINTDHNLNKASLYLKSVLPDINIKIADYTELKTENPTLQVQKNLNLLSDMGKKASITASVFPNDIFNKEANKTGLTCYITTNTNELDTDFKRIQKFTGMSDEKLSELLIRHEYAHCIQQGTEYKTLTKYNQTDHPTDLDNPMLTSKLRDTALKVQHNITPNAVIQDDYALHILTQSLSTTNDTIQREVFADGLALVSAYVDGSLSLEDVNKFLEFRKIEFDATHDDAHDTYKDTKAIFDKAMQEPYIRSLQTVGGKLSAESMRSVTSAYTQTWFNQVKPHQVKIYTAENAPGLER